MNRNLAKLPYSSKTADLGPSVVCDPQREDFPNYKIKYGDTIYVEIEGGTPPYDLMASRTVANSTLVRCGAPFDNRTIMDRPAPINGYASPKIILYGNSYNYTPSDWAAYGDEVTQWQVGDAIQFFAVEHANYTGPRSAPYLLKDHRLFIGTNYTLVATDREVGRWTSGAGAGAGADGPRTSVKALGVFALLAVGAMAWI